MIPPLSTPRFVFWIIAWTLWCASMGFDWEGHALLRLAVGLLSGPYLFLQPRHHPSRSPGPMFTSFFVVMMAIAMLYLQGWLPVDDEMARKAFRFENGEGHWGPVARQGTGATMYLWPVGCWFQWCCWREPKAAGGKRES